AEERDNEAEQGLELVSLSSQLTTESRRDKPDATRVTELKANVEKARLEYEALETALYVAHPELKDHRGEAPIIQPVELTAFLPDTATALLEYVVANEKTYLFVISKTPAKDEAAIQVYTLPVARDQLAK